MIYTPSEIKSRAMAFSREHAGWNDEKSQAQSFWRDFFAIFGVSTNQVGVFEARAKTLKGNVGFIDFFWPGIVMIEHKSLGRDLDEAFKQALDYCTSGGVSAAEVPRYIVVSDFARIRLHNVEEQSVHEFALEDLHQNTHHFNFILGYEKRVYRDQDPVNIVAAELMGKLHDGLKASGYDGHPLEVFLVRSMFMMFADDTGIFPKDHMTYWLEAKTREDGTDFGPQLALLFQILNTAPEKRSANLDEELKLFPYVNGQLFEEPLPFPVFDEFLRRLFLQCCWFDWSVVSPAIFGSLFQSVMDVQARRNLGAHYTSEKNILKTIHGLFLDDLHEALAKAKTSERGLRTLLERIKAIRLLDPACGCGNFLILAYRELRQLEIDIHTELRKLTKNTDQMLDIGFERGITVDHIYGIEIEEFPAQIARVALWIMDHLMNVEMATKMGGYQPSVPLKVSPHIVHGNALRLDWKDVVKPEELTYILGNPPFIGKHLMTAEQSADMETVFAGKVKTFGILDFVTAWYAKAAEMVGFNGNLRCAFVSTNSITQGEQPGVLWSYLFQVGMSIFFAHRTFKWTNEAKGNAAVYCVIIGFGNNVPGDKTLYEYSDLRGEPVAKKVKNISPYLIGQTSILLFNRREPLCSVPPILYGNKPVDDGHLILQNNEELKHYLENEPAGEKYIRKMVSAHEFLNGDLRHCFWLKDIQPQELRQLPLLLARVEKVKAFRLASEKAQTRDTANWPTLFAEIRQPEKSFVLVPMHSSENRLFVPFGFFLADTIVHNSCTAIPDATLYHFGIIQSTMHMAWMRQVCGRLKSDYRYSNSLVYNNFPWPEGLSGSGAVSPGEGVAEDASAAEDRGRPSPSPLVLAVERAAQGVLDARAQFGQSSLADLYDPLTMPAVLVKAHQALDRAVDACYRKAPFASELERVEFLFGLYEKYTAGLLTGAGKKGRK